MPRVIIADTSCFIVLTKIDKFELLKDVYGQITTTREVADEYGEILPEWVDVIDVNNRYYQQLLEMLLDRGESSAITLALEISESTLILDDYKARRIAEQLNLSYTGTIGVIIKAKLMGYIPLVKPILEEIKKTDFRISMELEMQALKEAKE